MSRVGRARCRILVLLDLALGVIVACSVELAHLVSVRERECVLAALRPDIARSVLSASLKDCFLLRVTVLGAQRMRADVLNAVHVELAVVFESNRFLLAANSTVILVSRSNRYIIVGAIGHLPDPSGSSRRVDALAMHGSTGFFAIISSSKRLLQAFLNCSVWTRPDSDAVSVAPGLI